MGDGVVCFDCSRKLIRWALETMASDEVYLQSIVHPYMSTPGWVRRYLLPACSRFFSESDNAGRDRCMVLNADNTFCYEVTYRSALDSKLADAGGPSDRINLCDRHWHLWFEAVSPGDLLVDRLRHMWRAERVVMEWQRLIAEAKSTSSHLYDQYLPDMTADELTAVWPWVLREARSRLPKMAHKALAECKREIRDNGCIYLTFNERTSAKARTAAFEVVHRLLSLVREEDAPVGVLSPPRDDPPRVSSGREFLVYRLYDEADVLLYVGKTATGWTKRMREHHREALQDPEKMEWWSRVATTKFQQCQSKQEMDKAELRAIREESPLHNKAGRPKQLVSA